MMGIQNMKFSHMQLAQNTPSTLQRETFSPLHPSPKFCYLDDYSFYPDSTGISFFQKIHSRNYFKSAAPNVRPKCYISLEKTALNFQSKFFIV